YGEHRQGRARGIFYCERSNDSAGERSERFGNENAVQKMRAVLALPRICRHEQGASGFVRSLRKRGGSNDEIRMTNDEVAAKSAYVIRASSLLWHSALVIRHFTPPQVR